MNTRILRLCRTTGLKGRNGRARIVQGLGQLQPVTFHVEPSRGGRTILVGFQAEAITAKGKPCLRTLWLPVMREAAKQAFADLECHAREGTKTPAAVAWERMEAP